jgi:hypothetical protein
MKSNLPRFWTPRTGGLLTLFGLAVVTVGATLLGESIIGRSNAPQPVLPGPRLTIAPMFKGLQAGSGPHGTAYAQRAALKVAHPHPAAIAVVTAVPQAATAPVVAPVVAIAQRPVSAPGIAQPAQYAPSRPLRRHRHKPVAPIAVTQIPATPKAALPTPRPLPPRMLVPVTTMTAPPPASMQLVPVQTVTAEPPASTQLVPVQTVTAAPPRT